MIIYDIFESIGEEEFMTYNKGIILALMSQVTIYWLKCITQKYKYICANSECKINIQIKER